MKLLAPIRAPKEFFKAERKARRSSLFNAFIATVLASTFIGFASTFAVFPLFSQTLFASAPIQVNINGAIWNSLFLLLFIVAFQVASFAFLHFIFKGKATFVEHAHFSSTASLVLIPVSILLSLLGLLTGMALRFSATPSAAVEFAASSFPVYASTSLAYSLFPVLGFALKLPMWVFDASAIHNSPVFFSLLVGPLLSGVAATIAQSRLLAEAHKVGWKKSLLAFILSALLVLVIQYLLFKVSYSFLAIS